MVKKMVDINTTCNVNSKDRKKSLEERVKNFEENAYHYQTLVEKSPICTKVIDLDRKLQYMSSAGVNALKIKDIEKFYDKPYPPAGFPKNIHDLYDIHFERCLKGELTSFECPIPDMEGHEEWYITNLIPIFDENGEVEYVLASSAHITARKMMEEEILKSQKLESIGSLAAGIAHDFNNLLTIILGSLEMAQLAQLSDDKKVNILKNAENACIEAKSLTNKLLTFAKGGEPVKAMINLPELVESACSLVLSGSNVRCHPAVNTNVNKVLADPIQMKQVIQNIIINAAQSMPAGGIIKVDLDNHFSIRINIENFSNGFTTTLTTGNGQIENSQIIRFAGLVF